MNLIWSASSTSGSGNYSSASAGSGVEGSSSAGTETSQFEKRMRDLIQSYIFSSDPKQKLAMSSL